MLVSKFAGCVGIIVREGDQNIFENSCVYHSLLFANPINLAHPPPPEEEDGSVRNYSGDKSSIHLVYIKLWKVDNFIDSDGKGGMQVIQARLILKLNEFVWCIFFVDGIRQEDLNWSFFFVKKDMIT